LHFDCTHKNRNSSKDGPKDELAVFKEMFLALDGKLNLLRDRLEVVENNME
jgi:hypothetical protein